MLIRPFFGLSLFLFATAFTPSAVAQTPPPTVPSSELSTAAPTLDAAVIIEVDSDEANVRLDGKAIEGALSASRSRVIAGHHVVEATLAGRSPIHREIDVRAGETVGVVLHMVPLSTDAIGYDAPKYEGPPRPDPGLPRLRLILIGAGVSVVALGLGIGFNLAASANTNDAEAQQVVIGQAGGTTSICNTPTARWAPACTALHDDLAARDQTADVAVVAYATAFVAAAATIAYAIWSRPPTEEHRRWTSSLRPAPIFGTSTGGFAVAGAF